MSLKSAVIAAACVLATLEPVAVLAAQDESLEQKDCVLSAAGLLPTIPELRITDAVAKPDASPHSYTVLVTVEVLDRTATYEYSCIYEPEDGALVEGGRMRK